MQISRREFIRLVGIALVGSRMPAWAQAGEYTHVLRYPAEWANKSMLRLDTFGISGREVIERFNELMAEAWIDGDRPAIFMRTVMEVGDS